MVSGRGGAVKEMCGATKRRDMAADAEPYAVCNMPYARGAGARLELYPPPKVGTIGSVVPRIEQLRALPSVDRVLRTAEAQAALARFGHRYVTDSVRTILDQLRQGLTTGAVAVPPPAEEVMAAALAHMEASQRLTMRPVVNATGVVLHTNLGRALLADAAVQAVLQAGAHAVNLEYDLGRGERGERDAHVEEDLRALTGAEAATVVNNNAAAVVLALNTLAEGREVLVSRGELIEIGGSFRIPEVLAKSGARLREVGTTNRTHVADYADAVTEHTALLLKVHTSNYRIVGFTSAVSLPELVQLGTQRGIPVMEDLGSGALVDLSTYGLPKEPVVAERLRSGADLVSFSGDKLLGGPQAGIIVGRRELVARLTRNPLKRALRCDKLTLAALAATLRLYRTTPDLRAVLPTLRWLTRPLAEMDAVGAAAIALLRDALGEGFRIELAASESEIGSGALPIENLPTRVIRITHPHEGAQEIARRFREAETPIIGRVQAGSFLLDLRGIFCPEDLVPKNSPE
ncbi:MAG: L-seryl-tRNA selenium transferase [Deltaproteobacteria bacterium]|nr:L-seryl-tRNA selenium transferase [Deltaproteobacteria bacterium]